MKKGLFLGCTILMLLAGCKKEPGFGGNAKIQGYVHTYNWNSTFTLLLGNYPGADVDVYLKAQDNIAPLDRVKTNYEGKFEFPFLYKGKYIVYTYSDDPIAPSGSVTILKEIEITKNKEVIQLDTLKIKD